MTSGCKHEHVVRMSNYFKDDTVKSWLQCTECNQEVKDNE